MAWRDAPYRTMQYRLTMSGLAPLDWDTDADMLLPQFWQNLTFSAF